MGISFSTYSHLFFLVLSISSVKLSNFILISIFYSWLVACLYLKKYLLLFVFKIYECFVYMCVCVHYMWAWCWSEEGLGSIPLSLGLLWLEVSMSSQHHQLGLFSGQCSKLNSALVAPKMEEALAPNVSRFRSPSDQGICSHTPQGCVSDIGPSFSWCPMSAFCILEGSCVLLGAKAGVSQGALSHLLPLLAPQS